MGELALYPAEGVPEPLVGAGKSMALLVYVALSPDRCASREHVAELLWPGNDLAGAQHCLRQALYRLRSVGGKTPPVHAEGHTLRVPPTIRLDCLAGEEATARGDFARAQELLRGGFLEGFSIPGALEFERWIEAQRERFRASWAWAACSLAEERLATGAFDDARILAEALAERRPFDPQAIRLLMGALAAQGEYSTAVARFRAYERLLRDEMNDAPPVEVVTYAGELEAIRGCEGPGASVGGPPFAGTRREWAVLEETWRKVEQWEGSAVLLEGPPGSGKSRLLAELRKRVQLAGAVVLSARCCEIDQTVPWAALAEAMRGLVGRPELDAVDRRYLAELTRLAPSLRDTAPDLPLPDADPLPEIARLRLHHALFRCCLPVADGPGLLITLEDVHWADPFSLQGAYALCRNLRETRALLIASHQPSELDQASRPFVRSLVDARLARSLSLDPDRAIHPLEVRTPGRGKASRPLGEKRPRHLRDAGVTRPTPLTPSR